MADGRLEMDEGRLRKSYDLVAVIRVVLFDLNVIWVTSGELARYVYVTRS